MNQTRNFRSNSQPLWKNLLHKIQIIWRRIRTFFFRPKVDEGIIFIHNRAFSQLKRLATKAKAIDNRKFDDREFVSFVKLKYYVENGVNEYEGIGNSLKLFEVALTAKDSYMAIEQVEFRYRSFKQQDFYNFVDELLAQEFSLDDFRNQVQTKLVEVIPDIRTEEGQYALQSYKAELDKISQHQLGLKLLHLFKQYELEDYSILRDVSDIVNSFYNQKLGNLDDFLRVVGENYSAFEKLGKVIGITDKKSKPKTYARMIQYMAMVNKYQASYVQFRQLLEILQYWQEQYEIVIDLRQEYNIFEYRQPKEFSLEIPGVELYERYHNWLTDETVQS